MLSPDDHPVTPATFAHPAHGIKLFVQRIRETDHEEPAKVVGSLLLKIVGTGGLDNAEAAVQ